MMQRAQKKEVLKTIFTVILIKLCLYFLFSLFYLSLLDWAGIAGFNIKYVIALTATIFFVWFFFNNLFSKKTKND